MSVNSSNTSNLPKKGGVTLASARKKRVEFNVNIAAEGEEPAIINGVFNPRSYSPARIAALNDLDAKDPAIWAVVLAGREGGSQLLVDWDLVYGDADAEDGLCSKEQVGEVVPITVEALCNFPVEVLAAIADAISENARPNSVSSAENSVSGSSLADEEGPVLESIDLSERQGS